LNDCWSSGATTVPLSTEPCVICSWVWLLGTKVTGSNEYDNY
jgi:hypothetical protein